MKKEGLTSCGYCHVKEEGKGPRNYRGAFYEAHENSFAGFDDAKEAKTAGVEVAPHADEKPSSLTPPAAAAPVAPPAATPAPMKPAPAATVSAVTAASDRAHAAKLAYEKSPKDAKLKTAYVSALASLTHATWVDTAKPMAARKADTVSLAKRVLALDPANASAKADLKAAGGK